MLNDLLAQLKAYDMLHPGDQVFCAVSGGADSMALLWGMYLLREKMDIQLQAAHFNHHLRAEESDRDETFVRDFCGRFDIPLTVGRGNVVPGKKGLEAAAREARYAFLDALPGKIATAHTADDNAETVVMHLIRGSGLKGLGGIAPVSGKRIRPMLNITRGQVEAFLEEYHIPHVEDSSNACDLFLRNRVRHQVMPLLKRENPRLSENISAMAQRLRQDEKTLGEYANGEDPADVGRLRELPESIRSRMLERLLKENGVKEPEAQHIAQAQALVFSANPSARACFPGGVILERRYDRLAAVREASPMETVPLPTQGTVTLQWLGLRVRVMPAEQIINSGNVFTVVPRGQMVLRCRQSADSMRLSGGTKSLKKLFTDRKIPASQRLQIPVAADDAGVLGVYTIGTNLDRLAKQLPAVQIRFEQETENGRNENGKRYPGNSAV